MADFVLPSPGVMDLPAAPAAPTQRAFDDATAIRRAVFDNTMSALQKKYPISNDRYTLRLSNLGYKGSKEFTPADQKKAIMRGRTLGWNLSGAWELLDNKTGQVVDKTKRQMVAQVPYMTDRGTFIFNGSEYTIAGQMRLRPGVYSRVKENGLIEAHFNVRGGTGPSFRVHMEPDSGVFRMHVGQANLKLYPILKAMGYDDRQLLKSWGRDLLQANIAASDPRAVQRAFHKLVREPTTSPTMEKTSQDEDANRRRAHFLGTVTCDDSKPEKPWVYLKVHDGLTEAAWEALHEEEPAAERRLDNSHITLVKNDEAKQLIDKYGKRKWKAACGNGRQMRFSLQNAMIDLNPDGWDDMDRVWFLEVRSPQMRAYRKSLDMHELPQGNDGEQPFHITIGVLPKKSDKQPRGSSTLDVLFGGKDTAKAAFERLTGMVKEADSKKRQADIILPFDMSEREVETTISKLALSIDVSDKADEFAETASDLYNIQSQAINDNEGNPAVIAARKRQAEVARENKATDTTKPTKVQHMLARLKERRGDSVVDDVKLAYDALLGRGMTKEASEIEYAPKMKAVFDKMELDPDTTEHTLGKRIRNVSPDLIVDVTKKLMAINQREAETDDRDSLAFQQVLGPEDFFAERISQDAGGLGKRLLWRSTFRGNTKGISPGALSPQLRSVLLRSGLAAPLEEVNPLEIFDQLVRVTRMGEGGMPSSDSIPDEARSVQPSHFGFIDPVRVPEGTKIGVDSRVAHRTYKGSDGNLYTDITDAKTGKPVRVGVQQLAKSVVAFPGELTKAGNQLRAMVRGKKLAYVDRGEVDYELPDTSHMFTATSNLVPMVSSIKGGRLLMGAKMCLKYNELIVVVRGTELLYVKVGAYEHQTGDRTYAIDPTTKQITLLPIKAKLTYQNERSMVCVKLKSGRTVTTTDNHNFVTLDDDGSLVEIAAGKLEKGIAIPRAGRLTFGADVPVFHVESGNNTVPRPSRDIKLDREFGWIIGMYLAEGCVSAHQRTLDFAARTPELRKRVYDFFDHHDATPCALEDQPFDRIRLHWTAFTNKLVEDFGAGSYHKRLPAWCFSASANFREGVVAGYLAGDGGYELRRERCRIKAGSRSKQLRDGIVLLLTTLGIDTVLSEYMVVGAPFYCFIVRAEHVDQLPDTGHPKKEQRRREFPAWSGKKSADWLPVYHVLHSKVIECTERKSRARQRCYFQQHTKLSIRALIGDGETVAHKWLESAVVWDKVERVDVVDSLDHPEVYDLDLDGNVFMCANGVFVHNSTQALPLQDAETPLVQNLYDDGSGRSFEDVYGEKVGAIRATGRGRVQEVGKGHIKVRYADGTTKRYDLYNDFPFNRRTYLHNSPAVKTGDMVGPGSLLAKSNYTDNEGSVAVGKNMRVGYLAYRGYNADDAIVISERAGRALSSEHMYTTKFKTQDNFEASRDAHRSVFPGRFDKKQLSTIADNGVVKPGTKLNYGDPVVLAVEKTKPSGRGVLRGRKPIYKDVSATWDHESPGTVTDVDRMKGGWKVLTRAYSPMNVGDKLANRHGNKGVVSRILPDDQMPHDKDGKPLDVLLSPLGVVSRVNPAQLVEAALGKIAKKTGKPYKVPGFMEGSYLDYAKAELQKHGLSDTEDLYDPESGRKIPKVLTGHAYIMKLHHMAEKKASGRDVGSYTSEGIPARGGEEGSKRIGVGELSALISHGATNLIRDAKVVRGQRNDDYWRALRLGYPPPSPRVPMVYEKFLAHLQGAGINLKKDGDVTHLFALTDADIEEQSNGALSVAETVKGNSLDPVEGGLFDFAKTGGHGGGQYSHIDLATPIPNPVMEEPIRRMLGLTKKKFEDVIAGKERIQTGTGTKAIYDALKKINLDSAIGSAEEAMREGTGQKRDIAVKKLGYLQTLKKGGISPASLMMNKVPVIPPAFRPITAFNKLQLTADPNFLYLDLMNANKDYDELRGELGEEHTGDERLKLYNAFKAVSGLGDPISTKSQQQHVRGLLKHIFGSASPKHGLYQRRLMGAAVDTVGRGVITPNPSLNMDQVGLPENKAWILYRPFIMRHLVRRGMQATAAAKAIEDQHPVARSALTDEMSRRPVIINRAPVLHKYGMMAAWPTLVKGNTLQVPPIVTSGFNADFDGDQQVGSVIVALNVVDGQSEDATMRISELEDNRMASYLRAKLPTLDENYDAFIVDLQDFPHGELLASKEGEKGRIDLHAALPGTKVLSYDDKVSRMVWTDVSHWSKHYDREVEIVTLSGGYQIITDDDPRGVYGIPAGTLAPTRCRPAEAEQRNMLVPRARKLQHTQLGGVLTHIAGLQTTDREDNRGNTAIAMRATIELDASSGYFIGAACGDGWVTGPNGEQRIVCLAGVDAAVRDKWAAVLRRLFPDGTAPSISKIDSVASYGESCKLQANTITLAHWLSPLIGRGAAAKHLPAFFLRTSVEFRLGLFAGLMDTDGSISVSSAKRKPQLMANFQSNSLRLAYEVKLLAATLNVTGRITAAKTPAGRPCWMLAFSNADIQRWNGAHMVHVAKLHKLHSVPQILPGTPSLVRMDLVPLSIELATQLRKRLGAPRDSNAAHRSLYSSLHTAGKDGVITRNTAVRLVERLGREFVASLNDGAAWLRLVDCTDVAWHKIEGVERTGVRETGYDLTVPGYETFMTVDGIILSNTMNYHVPVSDDAVQDAVSKMLPSRNLKSVSDFDVHYFPKQEFLHGLHIASTAKKRGLKTFRSKEDAIKAYKRGELDVGDRVDYRE